MLSFDGLHAASGSRAADGFSARSEGSLAAATGMHTPIGTTRKRAAREVAGWVPPLARLGYAARGVVYLLVGFMALRAATVAGSPAGAPDALGSLMDEAGGQLMLMFIAFGLAAHVLWRFVQAVLDPEHTGEDSKRIARRAFHLFSGVIYGSLAWVAWELSRGETSRGEGPQVWISQLLELPAGRWLVMAAGLAVITYGMHQIVKAWRGDVNRRMARNDRAVILIARIGVGARGLVLLPVGWFVFNAGRHYDPQVAGGTREALQLLDRAGLLALVGVGLIAFGLHQFAKAVYRRIERPS